MRKKRFWMTPVQLIALGFLVVISIGTILLKLPVAQRESNSISWIDALFTAVSAVCITGLSVLETSDTFNTFGHVVLAVLIQIGGLGITSIGVGLITFSGRRIRMRDQVLLQEALNYPTMRDIKGLIHSVLIMTFAIELIGAAIGFCFFVQDHSVLNALGIAVFHSISSFNNAGFDVFNTSQGMIGYENHLGINLLTAFLILNGGIGFFVIKELLKKRSLKKCSLHTKTVLLMTVILTVSGTLLLKLTEGSSISWLNAFFMSISTRAAGFTSINLSQISHAGLLLICLLMYIGSAPGSTGGGIKVTTFFVVLRTILAYPTGKHPGAFRRRFPQGTVQQALVIFCMGLSIISVTLFLLCIVEPDIAFVSLLFESVAAFSTVGLSTGITPELHTVGKVILMITMYIGRLGALTVASLWFRKQPNTFLLPEEQIPVG